MRLCVLHWNICNLTRHKSPYLHLICPMLDFLLLPTWLVVEVKRKKEKKEKKQQLFREQAFNRPHLSFSKVVRKCYHRTDQNEKVSPDLKSFCNTTCHRFHMLINAYQTSFTKRIFMSTADLHLMTPTKLHKGKAHRELEMTECWSNH